MRFLEGDDFMNEYGGVGTDTIAPTIDSLGVGSCNYSTSSSKIALKTVSVSFEYEAWFTGNIDDVSLAADVFRVESKILQQLTANSELTDVNKNCIELYNKATQSIPPNLRILGASKTAIGTIKKDYYCEQPKPVNQLPVFNRIACIPVISTITVEVPDSTATATKFTDANVKSSVINFIKQGMQDGNYNENNEIVGLVYTDAPHNKINKSGTVKKEMRPLGKGLLSAGIIVLFFLIVGLAAWYFIKKRRSQNDLEEEDEDLSLQKDDEESFAPTDSFVSNDDASPQKGPEPTKVPSMAHSVVRKDSEVSRHSAYPTKKSPSAVSKNNETAVMANDQEYEVTQFFCCK